MASAGRAMRRQMPKTLTTTGFGYMAFAGLATIRFAASAAEKSALCSRTSPRAQRVIFLNGRRILYTDTFDYKPGQRR
jgi:hypothetical protein